MTQHTDLVSDTEKKNPNKNSSTVLHIVKGSCVNITLNTTINLKKNSLNLLTGIFARHLPLPSPSEIFLHSVFSTFTVHLRESISDKVYISFPVQPSQILN